MNKLAFVLATAAALGLAVPAFAADSARDKTAPKIAQTTTTTTTVKPAGNVVEKKVTKTVKANGVTKKKVAVRHDRRHSAWRHAYAQQDCKVVKVRKHVDGRLIVKKIRRCV